MSWKDELNYGLAAFGVQIPDEVPLDEWAAKLGDTPARNTAALVALSTLLFYAAERDRNPKVNDVWDALVYTSTCLSVGYGDIFAHTPVGKILGSALMTCGPALSARVLDGSAAQTQAEAEMEVQAEHRRDLMQAEILATLKELLAHAKAHGAPRAGASPSGDPREPSPPGATNGSPPPPAREDGAPPEGG